MTTKVDPERIIKWIQKNPKTGRRSLVERFAISDRMARKYKRAALNGGPLPNPPMTFPEPTQTVPVKLRTLREFRDQFDVPHKIRKELGALGKDHYVTEEELRQLCEVPAVHWRRNAELPEFSKNKFRLDGVMYWASEDAIREMKRITGRV